MGITELRPNFHAFRKYSAVMRAGCSGHAEALLYGSAHQVQEHGAAVE
jgi:hypothetical protein